MAIPSNFNTTGYHAPIGSDKVYISIVPAICLPSGVIEDIVNN